MLQFVIRVGDLDISMTYIHYIEQFTESVDNCKWSCVR